MPRSVRPLVLAALLLVSGSGAALACGSGMLISLLLRAYPVAKDAFMAEVYAVRDGTLPLIRLDDPAESGVSYHAQRMERATEALLALDERLDDAIDGRPNLDSFVVFFVAEPMWSRVELTEQGAFLQIGDVKRADDEPTLHISARILELMAAGQLDFQQAKTAGYVALEGGPAQIDAIDDLLDAAYPPLVTSLN